jgi:hypothetical protein
MANKKTNSNNFQFGKLSKNLEEKFKYYDDEKPFVRVITTNGDFYGKWLKYDASTIYLSPYVKETPYFFQNGAKVSRAGLVEKGYAPIERKHYVSSQEVTIQDISEYVTSMNLVGVDTIIPVKNLSEIDQWKNLEDDVA